MNLITDNLGNIAVIAVLGLILGLIIGKLIKDKKSGKTSCGCGCEGCAMRDKCHK